MTGLEVGLTIVVSVLAGAELGSLAEYLKKYNLYDLEKDKVERLINNLHSLVNSLLYHVDKTTQGVLANAQKAL